MFPIADALHNEPLILSQLVRMAINGLAVNTLEMTMNRVTLDERHLSNLASGLERARSALTDTSSMLNAEATEV